MTPSGTATADWEKRENRKVVVELFGHFRLGFGYESTREENFQCNVKSDFCRRRVWFALQRLFQHYWVFGVLLPGAIAYGRLSVARATGNLSQAQFDPCAKCS